MFNLNFTICLNVIPVSGSDSRIRPAFRILKGPNKAIISRTVSLILIKYPLQGICESVFSWVNQDIKSAGGK